ncbi:MAG TPA: integrin, partial [Nitrospira sp.]|nr:integrin [Nitrospira sp.]
MDMEVPMTFPSQLRRLGTFSFLFLGAVAFTGCTTSGGGESSGILTQEAYLKASNTGAGDFFSTAIAFDGDTLVVGAPFEDSNATGVNGDQANNSASAAGAVYVFVRTNGVWAQQAYLKASNTGAGDNFGSSVALNGDTLVIGAPEEASNAVGVNNDQTNNSASGSGAVYVFTRSGTTWSQQAYLKASNTGAGDQFGHSVAIDGNTLVVGATEEASNAIGINGDETNNSASGSGAVYVFTRSGTTWSQEAYLKASNTEAGDNFGRSVALSSNTVIVGASLEDSNAIGVNGNQADNSASGSGAVYVFTRSGTTWTQQAYLKAS